MTQEVVKSSAGQAAARGAAGGADSSLGSGSDGYAESVGEAIKLSRQEFTNLLQKQQQVIYVLSKNYEHALKEFGERLLIFDRHNEEVFLLMDMGFSFEQGIWAFFQVSTVEQAVELLMDTKGPFDRVPGNVPQSPEFGAVS